MPDLSPLELLIRIAATVALCGVIGLEREVRGQVAGLRTHILVGLGAALFTLVSAYGFTEFVEPNEAGGFITTVDPTRIAAQVVAGIGFLGAGAIIRHGLAVRGVTTAAALWMAAAIGLACGAGFYLGAVAATATVLLSLIGFRTLRPRLIGSFRSDVRFVDLVVTSEEPLSQIFALLASESISVTALHADREEEALAYRLELRIPADASLESVLPRIEQAPGVESVEVHGTRLD